ncbi:hypothetical protein [Pseudomonas sp. LRF_L74]|uniref:hypothetical protein n=1 Tax=Pseudomonas sp. LRF_L74 TaxID=3369422 RepID=UPI003F5EE878
MPVRLSLICAALFVSTPLWAAKKVDLDYQVRFLPASGQAEVSLVLARGEVVRELAFNLGDDGAYSDFITQNGQWHGSTWKPGKGAATLSYKVRIDHQRESGGYDARMTPDWALLRGDDLVPSARLVSAEKVDLVTRLQFELPKGWKSVETGWPRIGENRFRIDNPSRLFERPTGWIVAGKLGSRRAHLGNTDVTVAAPVGEHMRRMDVLTMLTFVWPQVQVVFPREPAKVLVVGAGEPMWRGGLSASNSLFLHSDRPLVSENGTSPLVHELVHVFSRIRDRDRSDWISEGIAEYYAIELVRRAGGMSEDRYQAINKKLGKWGKKVDTLRTENSTGPTTARAVLLLQDLDKEIRKATDNQRSLDNVVQGMMRLEEVSTKDFVTLSEDVMGRKSAVLDSKLLR